MRAQAQAKFRQYSIDHEGFTPFPYCDNLNLVTTGIGNLIDASARNSFDTSPAAMAPALRLPWKFRAAGWTSKNPIAGAACSQSDIANAWVTCKLAEQNSPGFNKHGGFVGYPGLTNVTLDMDGINQLVAGTMAANEVTLRKEYPNWEALYADAQFALMSMSWAMGAAFWPVLRPHPDQPVSTTNVPFFQAFHDAIIAEDYAAAGVHCQFQGGGLVTDPKSRNHDNLIMFNNAAAAKKVGASPETLFFPGASPSGPGGVAAIPGLLTPNRVIGGLIVGGLFGTLGWELWKNRKRV